MMKPCTSFSRPVRMFALMVVAVAAAFILGGPSGSPSGGSSGGLWGGLGVKPAWADQHELTQGNVPGNSLGNVNSSQFWRELKDGRAGTVSIPDKKAGVLINRWGQEWRVAHTQDIPWWGGWSMLAMIVLLAVYFAYRGKIKIEHGMTGRTVERFNLTERALHWTTAITFVILGLTGLNVLYGKTVIMPWLGQDAFALITNAGKWVHNWIGFLFMASLAILLVMWIKNNLPTKADGAWFARLGGMLNRGGVHPPAHKFNAGQKVLFWIFLIGGASVSATGVALLMPFELSMFAGTFEILNFFGAGLPTDLSSLEETQFAQAWHAIVALGLIVVLFGHVYLGTIGMEGAFQSMYSGKVDENWAKEHHSEWAKELGLDPSDAHHKPEPGE